VLLINGGVMPPKIKVDKKKIIDAALEIVRKKGRSALNARSVADMLGCSTQPIFSNYANMDDLKLDVVKRAYDRYLEFREAESASGKYPIYKASGMAYIRFAVEENELFKLLFMSGAEELSGYEDSKKDWSNTVVGVASTISIPEKSAEMFHFEMWMFVHGIAVMLATKNADIDTETVSSMLSDVYLGLKTKYEEVK
jgi:AcrR family transcriptional regulator